VQKNSMRYAYAYDKGGKLKRFFGVEGIPHAVLIDANGMVAWSGHPAELQDSLLQQATSGALPKPLWEWTGAAKGVKTALVKHDYKSALDLAGKLAPADGGPEILGAIQGMVKSKVDSATAAQGKGDYLGAQSAALALQKELVGLPEAAQVGKIAADIAADKKALEVIKGQQKIAKIRAKEPSKQKEISAAVEDLQKLEKEYQGTYAETEAKALIGRLNDLAAKMKQD